MPSPFRRISITAWPLDQGPPLDFAALVSWLRGKGFELLLDETVAKAAGEPGGGPREQMAPGADLIMVLGGDGSMLYASHQVDEGGPPLLGINTGHLGFLADIPWDDLIPALERILVKGEYVVDPRMRLRPFVEKKGHKNGKRNRLDDVLNDVVITSGPIARMVEFSIALNGRNLGSFRADGLILATPTGSTAYSLSSGGPLVMPELEVMIICPICPHTLSNRPIVVPADAVVEVEFYPDPESPERRLLLTLDGQHGSDLQTEDRVRVERSPDPVRLVRPADPDYFQILRDKLNWETRPRGGKP